LHIDLTKRTLTVDFNDTEGLSDDDIKTLHELQAIIAVTIMSLIASSIAIITVLARRRAGSMALIVVAFFFTVMTLAIFGDVFNTLGDDIPLNDDSLGLSFSLSVGFYLNIVVLITRYVACFLCSFTD
jgi:hypothetical protein